TRRRSVRMWAKEYWMGSYCVSGARYWNRLPWLVALLTFGCLPMAKPAGAAPYYEMSAPYHLGTGHQTFGDPVDLATGAYMIEEPIAFIPGRVPISLDWIYTSRDNSNGPLGTGTSLSIDYFVAASSLMSNSYD